MPKIIDRLLHRHHSRWLIEFDPSGRGDSEYIAVYHGENVKAACKAGIIEGMTPDEVDELTPFEVADLSQQVLSIIGEAMQPPKKKT